MARYAIVEDVSGLVTNVSEWDGVTPWVPLSGRTAHQSDTAKVGDTWTGATFKDGPIKLTHGTEALITYLSPRQRLAERRLRDINPATITGTPVGDAVMDIIRFLGLKDE